MLLGTAYLLAIFGEPGRNRTCDPRIKSALLYQLSYGPLNNLQTIKDHLRPICDHSLHAISLYHVHFWCLSGDLRCGFTLTQLALFVPLGGFQDLVPADNVIAAQHGMHAGDGVAGILTDDIAVQPGLDHIVHQ